MYKLTKEKLQGESRLYLINYLERGIKKLTKEEKEFILGLIAKKRNEDYKFADLWINSALFKLATTLLRNSVKPKELFKDFLNSKDPNFDDLEEYFKRKNIHYKEYRTHNVIDRVEVDFGLIGLTMSEIVETADRLKAHHLLIKFCLRG